MIKKIRIITLIVATAVAVDYIFEKKTNYQIKQERLKRQVKDAIDRIMSRGGLRNVDSISEEMIKAEIQRHESPWDVGDKMFI